MQYCKPLFLFSANHIINTGMKRMFILCALVTATLYAQAIEGGKTYRILSRKHPTQSLFIKDSQREAGADIVLWADADVPSGQWKAVTGTGDTFILQNIYSGNYATPMTRTAGGTFQTNTTRSNGQIVVAPVNESENLYRLQNTSKTLSLTAPSGDNGALPAWKATEEGDDAQEWIFEEVTPKTTFTAEMRDEMLDAYLAHHLHSRGGGFRTFYDGGWGEAEQLEVLLDAYETTQNNRYLNYARQVYSYFENKIGDDWTKGGSDGYNWFGYDFNDDVMWMIIAVTRMGLLAENKAYITVAKKNFDRIYTRAYIPFTGLLRWAESSGERYGTNSCINGPAEVAACYLAMGGCGEEYFEKARDLYASQRKNLTRGMATGQVWDSVVWDPETETVKSRNEWASTYNQGTMLGAACLLYLHYNDEQYMSDARKIMGYTKRELCDGYGIIRVCQDPDNPDLCGFKGILMRYVRLYVTALQQTSEKEWMLRNAMRAYCNRTPSGLTGTAWLTKATEETTVNPFACSTAASAAANAPIESDTENAIHDLHESDTHDVSSSAAYYSLAGVRLSSPPSRGIYIIRQGGKSMKTMVK